MSAGSPFQSSGLSRAETWPAMIDEVKVTLPELVEVSGGGNEPLSLTFKAEQHLDLAGA